MLTPSFTKQFERDLKRMLKRGKKKEKIKEIIKLFAEEVNLPQSCRDHKLVGNYKGRRECHIEPDWLLLYKLLGYQLNLGQKSGF